jgi:hypothetical protein
LLARAGPVTPDLLSHEPYPRPYHPGKNLIFFLSIREKIKFFFEKEFNSGTNPCKN